MTTKASKPKKSTSCDWMADPEYTAYRQWQLRVNAVRAAHGGKLSAEMEAALCAELDLETAEIKRLRAQGVPVTEIKRLRGQGLLLPAASRAH